MKTVHFPIRRIAPAIGAAFALAAAARAHAVEGVVLYGIVSSGLGYLSAGAGHTPGTAYGALSGNRWGIRASDNLGGGVDAIFRLENGFSPSTGALAQGGRAFGRQSIVGLSSRRWGTVTFGRSYDPVVDMTQGLTAETFGSSPFATPGDVDNNDDSARVSNAVKYVSPMLAGLRFEAMLGLGGGIGAMSSGATLSAAASYAYRAFSLAGGYYQAMNTDVATGHRAGWRGASSDAIFDGGALNAGYASARTIAITQIAAQYASERLTLGAGYGHAAYRPDGQSVFAAAQRFDTGRVFGRIQFTPATAMALGYVYTRARGDASADYHQVSIGAYYNLSKRTDLYLEGACQRAGGIQRSAAGASHAAVASIGSYGIDGGRWQMLALAGIRHRF